MDILSYVTELLNTQKEVGIQGLGVLRKKKSPGRYDIEHHTFLPPTYTLDFIPGDADNRLAEYIGFKKNISDESATYYIEQFVATLHQQLAADGSADLGALGKLFSESGTISYIPPSNTAIGFDYYGLPEIKVQETESEKSFSAGSVISEPLTGEQATISTNAETNSDATEIPVAEETLKEAIYAENEQRNDVETPVTADSYWDFDKAHHLGALQQTDHIEEDPEAGIPAQHKPAYTTFAIVILVLLTLAAAAFYLISQNTLKPISSKQDTTHHKAVVKPDTSILKPDTTALAATDSTILKDSLVNTTPPVSPDTVTTWEIIGASVIRKEVDQVIAEMKSKGINPKIIPNMPGKKRIKISIATFYDEASAREGRKVLAEQLKNPELYIFQNKHTKRK